MKTFIPTHLTCFGAMLLRGLFTLVILLSTFYLRAQHQAPTALSASNVTASSFTARWSSVSNTNIYSLEVANNSSFSGSTFYSTTATSQNITDLLQATTYYYRVVAISYANGTSPSSNSISVTTLALPPAIPMATAATNIFSVGFTANWNGVGNASSYRLDISTSDNFSSFLSGYNDRVVSATSHNVVGLSANTTYYYRVRAFNSGGTSGNSQTITLMTAPPVPNAVAASNVSSTSFTANWFSSPGATEYLLDVSTSSTFASFVYENISAGPVAIYTVTGLSPSTFYYYRVRAANAGGTSASSSTISVKTAPPSPVVTYPTNITASSFTANWTASGMSSYRLDVSLSNDFSSFVYENLTVSASTSYSVTGLAANTRYYYRVRGVDTNGATTPNSSTMDVLTLLNPPTPSAATNITSTSFTANWNALEGANAYWIDVSLSSTYESYVPGYENLPVSGTSQSVTGLTPNTNYYYRVRATNGSGASGNSENGSARTATGAPVATAATNLGSTSFTANWNAVTGATSYRLDISTSSDFSSFVAGFENVEVLSTAYVVSGLQPNVYYYYRVRAHNGNPSLNSNIITVTLVPGAPIAYAATDILSTSFTANWQAISIASRYFLQVSTNMAFENIGMTSPITNSSVVTGLTGNTTYYYRVRAYNDLSGQSEFSNIIEVKTLLAAPVATAATNISTTSFTANWNALTGAVDYRLDVSTFSDFRSFLPGFDNLTVSGTSASVSGFPNRGTVYYRVRAVNALGTSPNSNVITALSFDMNYIRTIAMTAAGKTTAAEVESATISERQTNYVFFDGLGRPVQNLTVQGSPGQKDVVQPMGYDALGREHKKYLPYAEGTDGWFKPDALASSSNGTDIQRYQSGKQYAFYQTGGLVAKDESPYAETQFEASPLNRVQKQGAPGATWQPDDDPLTDRTVQKKYQVNIEHEVLLFNYDPLTESILISEADSERYYARNMLYANKTYDEHKNEVIEYVDKEGRTVCKKVQYDKVNGVIQHASTYYLYDEFGNLVVVLPPEAVKEILSN